jgi:hypothetical protein
MVADRHQPRVTPGLVGVRQLLASRLDRLQPTESIAVIPTLGGLISPS